MKEFNKYRKYLAEVQLDWDHRFRAEQVINFQYQLIKLKV